MDVAVTFALKVSLFLKDHVSLDATARRFCCAVHPTCHSWVGLQIGRGEEKPE